MTKNDLLARLLNEKVPTDTYSLNGGLSNEVYCLNQKGSNWEVYYSERGQKSGLKCFCAENEACEYFYKSLFIMLKDIGVLEMDENSTLNWIECDGGPHLLLEKHLVESWEGPNCELHYDKSCEIEDYVGLITVADGYGVVISEDIPRSAWIPAKDENGGSLVIINYVKENTNDNTIIRKIQEIDEELYTPTDLKISIQDSILYLFAACDTGPNWVYGYSEIRIKPGLYMIDTIEKYNFDDCSFRVHRFRKV